MAKRNEDWAELDALVMAEADALLAEEGPAVPADPAIDEAMFIAQACDFLARHPDPARLLSAIAARLAIDASQGPDAAGAGEADGGEELAATPPVEDDNGPGGVEDLQP